MSSLYAATPASAVAENGRRIEHAGERLGQRNSKKSPFRHAENISSKAARARRCLRELAAKRQLVTLADIRAALELAEGGR